MSLSAFSGTNLKALPGVSYDADHHPTEAPFPYLQCLWDFYSALEGSYLYDASSSRVLLLRETWNGINVVPVLEYYRITNIDTLLQWMVAMGDFVEETSLLDEVATSKMLHAIQRVVTLTCFVWQPPAKSRLEKKQD